MSSFTTPIMTHHPTSSQKVRIFSTTAYMWRQTFPSVLLTLSLLAAYLITGSFSAFRVSPPFFFTVALFLVAAALYPTVPVAIAAIALSITAVIFHALDHIVSQRSYFLPHYNNEQTVHVSHATQTTSHNIETECLCADLLIYGM